MGSVFQDDIPTSDSENDDVLQGQAEADLSDDFQEPGSDSISSTKHQGDALAETLDQDGEAEMAPTGSIAARAYQLEMYNSSLKRNIIVTMDTGSGKTQVAVMRLQAAMERTDKMAWFLAPTTSLCIQQHEVISAQIPSVNCKTFLGIDGIDSWSSRAKWAQELDGVRIVVCTHQILCDALDHSFVDMGDISLIVFDEAHNCVRNHPGSKIMRCHYHTRKKDGLPVPSILGLSASPSMNASAANIGHLEVIMDATCRTPIIHREELLLHSNRPTIQYLSYKSTNVFETTGLSESVDSLRSLFANYTLNHDPIITHLRFSRSESAQYKLKSIMAKNDTFCQRQVRSIVRRAEVIRDSLGIWAAEFYIHEVLNEFITSENKPDQESSLRTRQWDYLRYLCKDIHLVCPPVNALRGNMVSSQLQVLIDYLVNLSKGVKGIIFANERSTVSTLTHVLSVHEGIKEAGHKIGMIVGSMRTHYRTDLWDLSLRDAKKNNALTDFRTGKANILVATSVLEEGIDVPACNLVVCFDPPADFKSFIQRRGRARSKESSLVMMTSDSEVDKKNWEAQEQEIKLIYENEKRQIDRLIELEDGIDIEEVVRLEGQSFIVPSTGARLDMDNAMAHLHHFCAVLGSSEFVDSRPNFIFEETEVDGVYNVSAMVILPSFLPVEYRKTKSQGTWRSQKNSAKDAAFFAYIKLHEAGLVNDHLLPFKFEEFVPGVEGRDAVSEVSGLASPWPRVSMLWKNGRENPWTYPLRIKGPDGYINSEYCMALPESLTIMDPIVLYPRSDTIWNIEIGEGHQSFTREYLKTVDHTLPLLTAAFGYRQWITKEETRAPAVKFWSPNRSIKMDDIASCKLTPELLKAHDGSPLIVRDSSLKPYLFESFLEKRPPLDQVQTCLKELENMSPDTPCMSVTSYSKRLDFLHNLKESSQKSRSRKYRRVIPVAGCTKDDFHPEYLDFGMLIPCIIHEVEIRLLAKHLSETILKPVQISNTRLVREAMSSRASSEPLNYERIEFLGDSILKFMAAVNVCAQKLEWPEGYLTFLKDSIVANSRLQRVCTEQRLAQYILVKPFTGRKWSPAYIEDDSQEPEEVEHRVLSTKTLADFVEALIGASFLDGGLDRTLLCLNTLWSGDYMWKKPEVCRSTIYESARFSELARNLVPLEKLLGYTFVKKSLLIEAVTHASFLSAESWERSMERLEFLGDAVLDEIVVKRLFTIKPPLSTSQLHTMKTSLVNGDFLAWLSLSYTCPSDDPTSRAPQRSLWQFMRYSSAAIVLSTADTKRRFLDAREDLENEFKHGRTYPWAKLARLLAKKFYSDMFESIIGAMYIDSGSTEPCERFLEALGVFKILERMVRDKVRVIHPKELFSRVTGGSTVDYVIEKGVDGNPEAFRCRLLVNDVCWAEIDDGVSPEEAQVNAAHVALEKLGR
ncbi:hypothetical protein BROUX41_005469 [Berkeleyomyces rouxiae]|uniref:uncharacterized protein n=1 Tax=Berkeleyomyces rouxiae TaxID=2035830 RepID=UPI003B762432